MAFLGASPEPASAEAPELQMAAGLLLVLFLIGATLQVLALRKAAAACATPSSAPTASGRQPPVPQNGRL